MQEFHSKVGVGVISDVGVISVEYGTCIETKIGLKGDFTCILHVHVHIHYVHVFYMYIYMYMYIIIHVQHKVKLGS